MDKEKKDKPKYSIFQNVGYMLGNMWRFSKKMLITTFISIPLNLILTLIAVYIPKIILDSLELYDTFTEIALIITSILSAQIFINLLNKFINKDNDHWRVSVAMLSNKFIRIFNEKILDIDYEMLENPDIKNLAEKAREAVFVTNYPAMNVHTIVASFLINTLSFLIFGGILSTLNPLIIIILIITSYANYFPQKYIRNYEHRERIKREAVNRKFGYIINLSKDFSYAKDIRIYNLSIYVKDLFEKILEEYIKLTKKLENRRFLSSLVDIFVIFLRDGAAYIYLIYRAANGDINAGDFVMYFAVIGSFAGWFSGIFNTWLEITRASLMIADWREFIELEGTFNHGKGVELPPENTPVSIELRNISYAYPKSESPTLKNINLKIEAGEKIAIVGLNGAGKTTLVKLICGMYTPTEGRILVNGHEINEYNRGEYYSLISAVFQRYKFLPVSIAQNVAIENLDYDKIRKCIEYAGLQEKSDNLPDGINTPLIKEINKGGTELSGGESQKLLLARAIYKPSAILVLDEPTAALDPIAESELYEKYSDLALNRTSIFISHRLASTRFCDRIIYIENGEIKEVGSHADLLNANGKYAELFNIQSHYYKNNPGGENLEQ